MFVKGEFDFSFCFPDSKGFLKIFSALSEFYNEQLFECRV